METQKLNRREFLKYMAFGAANAAVLASCAAPGAGPAPAAQPAAEQKPPEGPGQLEIFSWWTTGGEVEALQALYDIYLRDYAGVEIINAAIAGGTGAGGQMKAVLKTRMLGGDPPDSFQVHLGHELIDTHAIPGRMEPLDSLYQEEGWTNAFPSGLIDIASWDGHPWSVPVNIHRSNVLWWNTKLFQEAGIDAPPETFDEFLAAAAKLKEAGYDAMLFGEAAPGYTGHVFEDLLAGHLGPDEYRGLWTGQTDWMGSKVEETLMFLKEILENFANDDYLSLQWGDTLNRFEGDTVGMMIMGDWTHGAFKSKGFKNYSWAPAMGTKGTFVMLSDSFGLPKGAPHRDNALNWLRVCGSIEGQEQFNIYKGSIPARTDVDLSKFDEYQRSAIEDFKKDQIVPSIAHGAAAKESWLEDYVIALNTFASNKDIKGAQESLARACGDAGACG